VVYKQTPGKLVSKPNCVWTVCLRYGSFSFGEQIDPQDCAGFLVKAITTQLRPQHAVLLPAAAAAVGAPGMHHTFRLSSPTYRPPPSLQAHLRSRLPGPTRIRLIGNGDPPPAARYGASGRGIFE
jgi:hypothetical protein